MAFWRQATSMMEMLSTRVGLCMSLEEMRRQKGELSWEASSSCVHPEGSALFKKLFGIHN